MLCTDFLLVYLLKNNLPGPHQMSRSLAKFGKHDALPAYLLPSRCVQNPQSIQAAREKRLGWTRLSVVEDETRQPRSQSSKHPQEKQPDVTRQKLHRQRYLAASIQQHCSRRGMKATERMKEVRGELKNQDGTLQ